MLKSLKDIAIALLGFDNTTAVVGGETKPDLKGEEEDIGTVSSE